MSGENPIDYRHIVLTYYVCIEGSNFKSCLGPLVYYSRNCNNKKPTTFCVYRPNLSVTHIVCE